MLCLVGAVVLVPPACPGSMGSGTPSPIAPAGAAAQAQRPCAPRGHYIVSIVCFSSPLPRPPLAFCTFHGRFKSRVKSMTEEQEIMCKLESIKEIRYVRFVPHQLHEAAFPRGSGGVASI